MSSHTTIKLLGTSLLVAISGGFKLYAAFLFLGIEPSIFICLASSLVIYAVYTLDRTLKSKEDEINREEFSSSNKICAALVICVSMSLSLLIFISELSLLPFLFPLVIGFAYSRGIKIRKDSLKLKSNRGVKNLVVAFTWATNIVIILKYWVIDIFSLVFIWLFFFLKSFINTVIYDFRDVKGDTAAGLLTLPIFLGTKNTTTLLYLLHIVVHLQIAMAILWGKVKFDFIILPYSAIIGLFYVGFYSITKERNGKFRDIIVDGEWIIAVFLSVLIHRVSFLTALGSI